MRHFAARRFGLEFSLGAICALSACAAEQTPAASAINPARTLHCELFLCPSNFVPVAGLRSAARSVVAGGNGVWALDDQAAIYRFNENSKQFDPVPGSLYRFKENIQQLDPVPGSLAWISVGGGNLNTYDEVWGGTADERIFQWRFVYFDLHWRFMEVAPPPGDPIRLVAVGSGHNVDGCHLFEIWGISVTNRLFRFNYSCLPTTWQPIQGPPLVTVSVGRGEVWGLDAARQVYRFDPATVQFKQVPGTLNRIAVGVDGVWGVLDIAPVDTGAGTTARLGGGALSAPQVFQYDAATNAFVQIPNAEMKDIAAGGNGVWALDQSGHVFRLQAVTRKFIPVPSVPLLSLTVGSGTDVWGIDQNHQIRAFVTPERLIGPNAAP